MQGLKATSDSVNQAQTRRLPCEVRVDFVVVHVVGDVLHDLVGLWTDCRLSVVSGHCARGRGRDDGGGGGRAQGRD